MATNNNTPAMSEKPLHRGRGWGGSSSLKNREAFFDYKYIHIALDKDAIDPYPCI